MAPNPEPSMQHGSTEQRPKGVLERMHKSLLLLAILAATVTYAAGLSPPGGVWPDDAGDLHRAGDPVLQANYPARYNVFFYCNATAFVASLVIIMLLLSSTFSFHGYRVRALQAAMVLDVLGLMGAFTAGSCRNLRTSMFVVVLMALVIAYVVGHLLVHFCIRSNRCPSNAREMLELLNLHRLCRPCGGGVGEEKEVPVVVEMV